MKVYLTYFFAGLSTTWVLLIYLGFSSGFSNYSPVAGLFGAISLFVLANPIALYRTRLGLIIGLVSSLLMLPYILSFTVGIFSAVFSGAGISFMILLMFVPSILVLLSLYFSAKGILNKQYLTSSTLNAIVKLVLAVFPIFLFILYLIFYGNYWSWEMFNI